MASPQKENGFTAIANEILEALCKIRIPGEARQMLAAILRKTYGYNKLSDNISTKQFTELTGLSAKSIYNSRKTLVKMNIITIAKKGDSQVLNYSFQKDYDKWGTIAKIGYSQKRGVTIAKFGTNYSQKTDCYITKDNKDNKDNSVVPEFFSYYLLKTKKAFRLTDDCRALITKRLTEGYTLDQLKKAVDNFILDPWPERKNRLELIYCIGKQRGKPDALERWLNFTLPQPEYRKP